MNEKEEDKKIENKIKEDENGEDFLKIDNLNINQEVDIKENPKKHIVNIKKKIILNNSLDDNYFDSSENILNKNNSSKKSISYDDIYLGNEMLKARPKSFPKDYEKNNNYIKTFSKMYNKGYSSNSHSSSISSNSNNSHSNKNSESTNNISNASIDQEDEYDDEDDVGVLRNNSFDFFGNKKKTWHLRDYLIRKDYFGKNNENNFYEENYPFIDEEEMVNKNIFFIENETELNNL